MHRPAPTTRAALALLLAGVVALTVAACGDDEATGTTTSTTASTSPTVTGVWSRPAAAGGTGVVYLTIAGGDRTDQLTGAAVPADVAASTELHETTTSGSGGTGGDSTTTTAGGMMSMHPVDRITVDAGATVRLEPGGYHIMLMDLQRELRAGDTIPVTLTFEHAGPLHVTSTVREP